MATENADRSLLLDVEDVPSELEREAALGMENSRRWTLRRSHLGLLLGLVASASLLYMWPFSGQSSTTPWSSLARTAPVSLARAPEADPPASLLPEVSVKPYGVLGVQLDSLHHFVREAPEPYLHTAVVDPAGLRFIHDIGPAGAGGASHSIYAWLQINLDARFPAEVRSKVQQEGDAKMHQYGEKQVIHVVGPDFTNVAWASFQAQATAQRKLVTAYRHVLEEFAASKAEQLRMLPISGGTYQGPFHRQLPKLTFQALDEAFRSLPAESRQQLLQRFKKHPLEMCIFEERELPAYQAACPSCA